MPKRLSNKKSEANIDKPNDLNNYVGEWTSMISNVSNDQTNERIIDPTIIDRELSPNPSQEEVKRRICEKDWVTYECRGKQIQK